MAARNVSYGKCFVCGKRVAKNGVARHLEKCLPAHEPEAKRKERLFIIRAEGRYAPGYWLYLEMPARATLADLDGFLRDIWLECCGHLSAFEIDDVRYKLDTDMVDGMWEGIFGRSRRALAMEETRLDSVLQLGQTFYHEYDFGTTTHLKLQVVGEREGPHPRGNVRLLARNYAPVYPCSQCGAPAKWINVYEGELYCQEHAEESEDWEEAFLPLVNSPRAGECGYTGPSRRSLAFEEPDPVLSAQGQ